MNTLKAEFDVYAAIAAGRAPEIALHPSMSEREAALEWLRAQALSNGPDWRKAAIIVQELADPRASIVAKRHWYAGAEAVLRIMWNISANPKMSDDAGGAIIEGLHQETRQFAREYGQQRGVPAATIEAVAGKQESGPRA